jgi:hypothetical protein
MSPTRTAPAQNTEYIRNTSSHYTSTRFKPQAHTITEKKTTSSEHNGPDGGFHTGYDQTGTYAGTRENAETTSIAIIAISSLSTTSPFAIPFFSIPPWIIYLYTGLAVAAVGIVFAVLVLGQKKRK